LPQLCNVTRKDRDLQQSESHQPRAPRCSAFAAEGTLDVWVFFVMVSS